MYGTGTRSYNRSAEKRESDRQRAAATAAHQARPQNVVEVPIGCPCCRFVVCIYRGRPMSATSRDWEAEPWRRLLFAKR
jgi:hypothetical protein